MALMILLLALLLPAQARLYTLSDSKLTASFSGAGSNFGLLTELRMVSHQGSSRSVIDSGAGGSLWTAGFVGTGTGIQTISSASARCNHSAASDSPNALTLKWTGCIVQTAAALNPSEAPTVPTWTQHKNSNCGGKCLDKDSKGPKGGHCDRMPGCGHDAGLPYCDPAAMKERCLNASKMALASGGPQDSLLTVNSLTADGSLTVVFTVGFQGCTAFNTNGYLYNGNSVVQFSEYPLDCYTYGTPPPPPAAVDVTVVITLTDGMLEYAISFASDGRISLWQYTISIPNLVPSPSMKIAKTGAAKQMLGLYESDLNAPAVYFAAVSALKSGSVPLILSATAA